MGGRTTRDPNRNRMLLSFRSKRERNIWQSPDGIVTRTDQNSIAICDLLVAPHLEISLHKTIGNVNDDLLGELRIAHADRVDDALMVCDLRHPRTCVKALSQSAHQREGI